VQPYIPVSIVSQNTKIYKQHYHNSVNKVEQFSIVVSLKAATQLFNTAIIRKTRSTQCIAMQSDQAKTTGNMHKKFGEVWPCGFRVMQADRQTDIQTILRTLSWKK